MPSIDQRPSLDDLFLQNRPVTQQASGEPSLDDLFVSPNKSQPQKASGGVPFLPVAEDIPGIAASAMHGATQGLTDVGREPISKIMSGYPGEMTERGAQIYKNPKRTLMQGAMEGPSGAVRSLLQAPLETPETKVGFPVAPQPRSIIGRLAGMGAEAAAGALTGEGIDAGVRRLAPSAERAGIGVVRRMIRPSGEFAESGDEISKALLDEGLVRGSKDKILSRTLHRGKELNDEIENIINQYSNRRVSPDKALQYMRDVKAKYKGNAALDSVLSKVDEVINKISSEHNLKRPTYDTFEDAGNSFLIKKGSDSKLSSPKIIKKYESDNNQFVIRKGSESKSINPAIQKDFPLVLEKGKQKREPFRFAKRPLESVDDYVDPSTGASVQKDVLGEALLSNSNIENPEDMFVLPGKNKKATVVYPKKETSVRSEDIRGPEPKTRMKSASMIDERVDRGHVQDILGPDNKKMIVKQTGEAPNLMSLKQAQIRKKGQYEVTYDSDAETPERTTRKAYARGLKEGIEGAVPEKDIAGKNKRIGLLSNAAEVLGKRLGVEKRNNAISLGDMVLAGALPKAAIIRKLGGLDRVQSLLARSLYEFPKNAKNLPRSLALTNTSRRLLAQEN